jgi:hypothetical protein
MGTSGRAVAVAVRRSARLAVCELCGRPTRPRGRGAQPDPMSTPARGAKRAPPSRSSSGQWSPLITCRTPPVAVARGCRVGQAADPDRLAGLRPSFGRRCESTAAFILVPRRGKSLLAKFPTSRPELRSHQVYSHISLSWILDRADVPTAVTTRDSSSVLTSLLYLLRWRILSDVMLQNIHSAL